jgi:hypothetical protein
MAAFLVILYNQLSRFASKPNLLSCAVWFCIVAHEVLQAGGGGFDGVSSDRGRKSDSKVFMAN